MSNPTIPTGLSRRSTEQDVALRDRPNMAFMIVCLFGPRQKSHGLAEMFNERMDIYGYR